MPTLAPHARASNYDMSRFESATLNIVCGVLHYQLMKSLSGGAGNREIAEDFRNCGFIIRVRYGEGQMSSSSDEAKAADTETDLTSGGRRETSHGRRQIQGRVNEGSNATVSKAMSPVEPPRRLKQKAIVMSSSSSEDDLRSGVSYIVAEIRAVTLTEPLRKSDGDREDDFRSDSDN